MRREKDIDRDKESDGWIDGDGAISEERWNIFSSALSHPVLASSLVSTGLHLMEKQGAKSPKDDDESMPPLSLSLLSSSKRLSNPQTEEMPIKEEYTQCHCATH